MANVYSGIKGLDAPAFSADWDKYDQAVEEYVAKVKSYARENGDCQEAGEEIQFPVADGCARYVVLSLKPVKLVHLAVDDAWHFRYVNRLTAKDIREAVRR